MQLSGDFERKRLLSPTIILQEVPSNTFYQSEGTRREASRLRVKLKSGASR